MMGIQIGLKGEWVFFFEIWIKYWIQLKNWHWSTGKLGLLENQLFVNGLNYIGKLFFFVQNKEQLRKTDEMISKTLQGEKKNHHETLLAISVDAAYSVHSSYLTNHHTFQNTIKSTISQFSLLMPKSPS